MLRNSVFSPRARLSSTTRTFLHPQRPLQNPPIHQHLPRRPFTHKTPHSPDSFSRGFTFSSHPPQPRLPQSSPSALLQRIHHLTRRLLNTSRRRHNTKTTNPNPTPILGSPPKPEAEPQTLGARMRKLSREYGWSALGVYLALSALDFPFCYMLVRYLGTERIGKSYFEKKTGGENREEADAVFVLPGMLCCLKVQQPLRPSVGSRSAVGRLLMYPSHSTTISVFF